MPVAVTSREGLSGRCGLQGGHDGRIFNSNLTFFVTVVDTTAQHPYSHKAFMKQKIENTVLKYLCDPSMIAVLKFITDLPIN